MSIVYALNYLIFSAFLTLLMLEVGIGIIALVTYRIYSERIKRYISTMWEIEVTFGVFYLVNFELSYPKLLPLVGTIYILPALVAALFLIIRNAFIAYSNYAGKLDERKFVVVYSIATLAIAFFALSILTSSVTGYSINIAASKIDLFGMFFNAYNILILVSAVLLSLFIAAMFFGEIKFTKRMYLVVLIAYLLFVAATYAFVPYIFSNLVKTPYLMVVSVVLLGFSIFYKVRQSRFAGPLVLLWIFISINLFGALEFPYMFGKAVNITQYIANPAIAGPASIITIVCSILLSVGFIYLIKLSYTKSSNY